MNAQDIIDRARGLLHDTATPSRWTTQELVDWINDGCMYLAVRRPDSCSVSGVLQLAVGTRQSIAGMQPEGLRVLDVVRNMADGVPARPVRLVQRESLDASRPTWHSDANSVDIRHWVFDNRLPREFYCWPPAMPSAAVEVVYTRRPVAVTMANLSAELTPDPVYIDALTNYVMHRAYSKDASFALNANLAAMYRAMVDAELGDKATPAQFGPALNNAGGKPAAGTAAGGV